MLRSILVFLLVFLVSCNEGPVGEVQDKLNDSFANNPKPSDVQVSPICFEDYHKIEASNISRKLDILVVIDTSGSIKEERSRIAKGFDNLTRSLPENVDYNIGVLLAHGEQSVNSGRLYKKNHDPRVLKSSELSIEQIKEFLDLKIYKPKEDGQTDGGEMGMLSLLNALKPDNLNAMKAEGLFREDAALAVVFIADEQDICAKAPEGVTFIEDRQNKERMSFVKYCIEENIKWKDVVVGGRDYTYKITPEMVVNRIKEVHGDKPLVIGGVLYDEDSVLPGNDEDEIGYGYHEMITLADGISVDLADGDYGDGLTKLGRLATAKMELENSFPVKNDYVDPLTLRASVDGNAIQAYYEYEFKKIFIDPNFDQLGTIKLEYCSDSTLPIINLNPIESITSIDTLLLDGSIEELYFDKVTYSLNGEFITESTDKNINQSLLLVEGTNTILIEAFDKLGNKKALEVSTILDLTPPVISIENETNDSQFTKDFNLIGSVIEANDVTVTISLNGVQVFQDNNKTINKNLTLAEGENEIKIEAIDQVAFSADPVILNITVDTEEPVVSLLSSGDKTTNEPLYNLDFNIFDASETTATILLNGQPVVTTNEKEIRQDIMLQEGINLFSIQVVDSVGNAAPVITLGGIILDTQAPIFTQLYPEDNGQVRSLVFNATGTSNEKLKRVQINGFDATLTNNDFGFSYQITNTTEGEKSFELYAEDFAGNIYEETIYYSIVTRLIIKELVTVVAENGVLKIKGAVGSTFGGVNVSAYSNIFDRDETIAAADGSFELEFGYFETAQVTAEDTVNNRLETFTLDFDANTALSGVIRDIDNNPLPGVTVIIATTGQSAITNATGVFSITDPALGKQRIIIDGSTVPVEIRGENRQYFASSIELFISNIEPTVIETPIYLNALIKDGNEVLITEGSGAIVSSPNAEGAELVIEPGVTEFPSGSNEGEISINFVQSDRLTVPPPRELMPTRVLALEPSGVEFTEPVEVTLPNDNNLPAGTEMMIISKNSGTGEWELDGVATVNETEDSITTKPGQGITHFSEIYAVPVAPMLSQMGDADKPGVNTDIGILTRNIELPSYKNFNKELIPGLIYKSNWANPTALIKNVFSVPRGEITRTSRTKYDINGGYVDYSTTITQWVEPEYVDFQFRAGDIVTDKTRYTGIPSQSVITYAMDISDFESGIHPYRADFDLQLSNLFMTSLSGRVLQKNNWYQRLLGKGKYDVVNRFSNSFSGRDFFSRVIPQTLTGALYVQNKKNSYAGRGWKVSGLEQILNIGEPRLVVEDDQGNLSTYLLDNTITTVYNHPEELSAASFYNDEFVFGDVTGNVYAKTAGSAIEGLGVLPKYEGKLTSEAFIAGRPCRRTEETYSIQGRPLGLLLTPDGDFYGTDGINGIISSNSDGSQSLMYKYGGQSTTVLDRFSGISISFPFAETSRVTGLPCGGPPGTGSAPFVKFQRDAVGSNIQMNSPSAIVNGPEANTIIFADQGSGLVRKINLETNEATLFAGGGNQSALDQAYPADQARLIGPQALTVDRQGNVYIATNGGKIKRVDTNGLIHHVGGGSPNAVLSDVSSIQDIFLEGPKGLAFDDDNNFLYVADTDNHRVLRLDFETNEASVIAGTGICNPLTPNENTSALNASLCFPSNLGLGSNNNLIVLDQGHGMIRKINFDFNDSGYLKFAATTEDGSYIERDDNGQWIRTFRNGSTTYYNDLGYVIERSDRLGNTSYYSYDSENKIKEITNPANKKMTFNYSGSKLSSIVDQSGRQTSFNYSGNDLVSVNYPDNSSIQFRYDQDGVMTSETNQRGGEKIFTWGRWQRLKEIMNPDGTTVSMYEAETEFVANDYTVGLGQEGEFKIADFDAEDAVFSSVTDGNGNETKVEKDVRGYIIRTKDPQGNTTEIQRDLKGRITKVTQPDGSFTSFEFDQITGDLLKKIDSVTGLEEEYTYNLYGNMTSLRDNNGKNNVSVYEPSTGLLLSETDSNGNTISRTYYPNGQVKTITNGAGEKIEFIYNSVGNLVEQINPDGTSSKYTLDNRGNVTEVERANGVKFRYQYDEMNRVTSVAQGIDNDDPVGKITSYRYLPTGELTEITDPVGNKTTFDFNLAGRLVRKISPLGQTWEYSYDSNGNVATEKDPNGNLKTYSYNEVNQVVRKSLPDDVYTLSYDLKGNITQVSNSESTIDYTYVDIKGESKVKKVESSGSQLPDFDITYNHDLEGNVNSMDTTVGTFSYFFDNNSRLTNIQNPFGENFVISYDRANRVKKVQRPNGSSDYGYAGNGFLNSILHKNGSGQTINGFLYQRDNSGNILSESSTRGIKNYAYNSENQLVASSNDGITGDYSNEVFSYDDLGNRTGDSFGGFVYDPKKYFLQEDYRYLYTYDNNGNLTSRQEKGFTGNLVNYSYTSQNQLSRVEIYTNGILAKEIQYFYDALGRRSRKVIDNRDVGVTYTRKFKYDGESILAEYNENNNLLATYTHTGLIADDTLAVNITNSGQDSSLGISGSYHFLKDNLGSIVDIVDSSGNLIQHYTYSSYGKIIRIVDRNNLEITDNPIIKTSYTFTNREYDFETGMYYYRARYYQPEIGRFISEDAHPGSLDNPNTLISKYVYTLNNPINAVDPSGLYFLFKITIGDINWGAILQTVLATVVLGPIGLWADINFSGNYSADFVNLVNGAVIATAAAFTGGAAAVGSGFLGSIVTGAAVGAATGGVLGGAISVAHGNSFSEGFKSGAIVGALAGSVSGLDTYIDSPDAKMQALKGKKFAQTSGFNQSVVDLSPDFLKTLGCLALSATGIGGGVWLAIGAGTGGIGYVIGGAVIAFGGLWIGGKCT